jgi:hypothetical protein
MLNKRESKGLTFRVRCKSDNRSYRLLISKPARCCSNNCKCRSLKVTVGAPLTSRWMSSDRLDLLRKIYNKTEAA